MDIKQEYLSAAYPESAKKTVGGNVRAAFANPLAQIALVGVVLALVQFLALGGMISSAFAYALGNTLIYAIVAIGFCLLLGYSGLASLGTAGFIGLGSYVAFYLIEGMGAPYYVALLVTLAVSIALGVIVGFISLRIEGIYLAIMTLALAEIIRSLLMVLKATIKININNIVLFGVNVNEKAVYLLITATFIILMALTSNLIRSPVGRAMLAMKDSTSAAQAMGISLMKYRLLAFVISTIYAAMGGLLYMMYVRNMTTATSTLLTLSTSLNILGAVIIGGAKSLWGTTFGLYHHDHRSFDHRCGDVFPRRLCPDAQLPAPLAAPQAGRKEDPRLCRQRELSGAFWKRPDVCALRSGCWKRRANCRSRRPRPKKPRVRLSARGLPGGSWQIKILISSARTRSAARSQRSGCVRKTNAMRRFARRSCSAATC